MSEPNTFADFIRRIRAGDDQAAVELVQQYEPLIRRHIRLQLEDRHLSRLFDSMDICQSVLASFFLRTAAGEYDLEQPEQLLRLLVSMTRNKLASTARRHYRQRRDNRRIAAGGGEELAGVADSAATPSSLIAGKELLERFRQGLSDEERRLAELRSEGLSWADIAAKLGGAPQGRRMQLARAVERVSRELGLEEGGDE
jgi:RNA polymerase sigma-70 factor (ECF subfamily)